jgi:hypothetical protein
MDKFTFSSLKCLLLFLCAGIILSTFELLLAASFNLSGSSYTSMFNDLPTVVPRIELIRTNQYGNYTVPGTKPSSRGSIVIAMGLCCSKKSQQIDEEGVVSGGVAHRHGKKAYDVAAFLSARLWLQQDPSLKVVIMLAYTNTTESKAEMQRMTGLVEMAGAIPWPYSVAWSSDPDKACVRAGQTSRMFAHESGLVADSDFVITADADIFPVNATRMLAPVRETNKKGDFYRLWLGTYQWTFQRGTKHAGTIALGQVGQSAADWRHAMELSELDLKKAIVWV